MSHPVTLGRTGFLATLRRDRWWVEPALVAQVTDYGASLSRFMATQSAVPASYNFV